MVVAALTVLTPSASASASPSALADPICADRPGKASATCTTPAGRVQIETGVIGWSLQRGGGARATELDIGATAIKYGISERAHVEIDIIPLVRAASHGGGARERATGIGDTLLRVKHRLTANDAPVQVALYPLVKLPTARQALGNGNGKVEAGLAVPIAAAIAGTRLSLALTPEVDWLADADGRGRHAAMTQAASLGWAATERWTLSVELWGGWDWDPAGTVRQASADGAIAYLARDDLQLDAGANVGLNRATADVELYVGIAKRF